MDRQKFLKYWLPVIIYVVLIFLISSLHKVPTTGVPSLIGVEDKVFHLFEYAILAFLLLRALTTTSYSKYAFPLAVAIAILYGFSDEVHQLFVPGRSFSVLDLLFDSIGGASIFLLKLKKSTGFL